MRGWERRLIAFMVGMGELAALLLLSATSPAMDQALNLWQLFVMSVICTAGLGLLIWLPLCWFLGEVTLWLLGLVTSLVGRGPTAPGRENARLQPSNKSLTNLASYVQRMREAGVPNEPLRERLRRAGWDDPTIAAVMRGVDDR